MLLPSVLKSEVQGQSANSLCFSRCLLSVYAPDNLRRCAGASLRRIRMKRKELGKCATQSSIAVTIRRSGQRIGPSRGHGGSIQFAEVACPVLPFGLKTRRILHRLGACSIYLHCTIATSPSPAYTLNMFTTLASSFKRELSNFSSVATTPKETLVLSSPKFGDA